MDNTELLKKLYRRAIAVCHPDRAPAHLHSFMEAKAKELTAAYEAGSLARVCKIAEELGVKDIPPMPKSEFVPKPSQADTLTEAMQNSLDTALLDAADSGNLAEVNRLLATGANPNAATDHRETALMWAAQSGHTEVAKVLLSAGADVNAPDVMGQSALLKTAMCGYDETIQVLLSAGANPHQKDYWGKTPYIIFQQPIRNALSRAVVGILKPIVRPLTRRNKAEQLEAKPQQQTHKKQTEPRQTSDKSSVDRALFSALFHRELAEVKRLLATDANPNAVHEHDNGLTALMIAVHTEHAEIINALLSAGANPNAMDNKGTTALMVAAFCGHVKSFKLLLAAGADPNHAANDGITVLDCTVPLIRSQDANKKGCAEIARILRASGAVSSTFLTKVRAMGCVFWSGLTAK